MKTLNVASARDSFSRLVDEVHESGEGVIVAKYGHPFVMLVPFVESKPKRNPYPLRGMPYRMADDFDDPMPELATMVAESDPDCRCGEAEASTATGKAAR